MGQFPPITPLALLLKQFLADRSLDHPYKGGLSSYCQVNGIFHVLKNSNFWQENELSSGCLHKQEHDMNLSDASSRLTYINVNCNL